MERPPPLSTAACRGWRFLKPLRSCPCAGTWTVKPGVFFDRNPAASLVLLLQFEEGCWSGRPGVVTYSILFSQPLTIKDHYKKCVFHTTNHTNTQSRSIVLEGIMGPSAPCMTHLVVLDTQTRLGWGSLDGSETKTRESLVGTLPCQIRGSTHTTNDLFLQ